MSFAGRTVLVAGASGALGRAVCLAFLEARAHVAATARSADGLRALAEGAGAGRERLRTFPADASDPAAAVRLVAAVVAACGSFDSVVDTVGAWEGGTPLWETDPDDFERMLSANLRSAFSIARAALPHLLEQRRGWIVSVASRAAFGGQAGSAAYAAAKAGLVALVASVAAEVQGRGVNVNAVVPDVIDTPANRHAMPRADRARWSRPEDIARVIRFLCTEDARAIQGAAIPVTAP